MQVRLEIRLAVIAGLIDSDGTYDRYNNEYRFSQMTEEHRQIVFVRPGRVMWHRCQKRRKLAVRVMSYTKIHQNPILRNGLTISLMGWRCYKIIY
jgi:hypothetical protein